MKKMVAAAILVTLAMGTGSSFAGPVTDLTTFTPGTPARADSVNDNFTAVKTAVDDNAQDIAVNSDGMASNASSIESVKGQLGGKLDALVCSDGQVLKYNSSTGSYDCAQDLDTINTDAQTLDGLDSSDFALSQHSHDDVAPGVFPVHNAAFSGDNKSYNYGAVTPYIAVGPLSIGGLWAAPLTLPFKATIIGAQAKVMDNDTEGYMWIRLSTGDGTVYMEGQTSIAGTSSSAQLLDLAPTVNAPLGTWDYDPATEEPHYIAALPLAPNNPLEVRLYWVKVLYTIP